MLCIVTADKRNQIIIHQYSQTVICKMKNSTLDDIMFFFKLRVKQGTAGFLVMCVDQIGLKDCSDKLKPAAYFSDRKLYLIGTVVREGE